MNALKTNDLFCTVHGPEGGMWFEVWHYENETVRFATLHARLHGAPVSYSSTGFATVAEAEAWCREKARNPGGVES